LRAKCWARAVVNSFGADGELVGVTMLNTD